MRLVAALLLAALATGLSPAVPAAARQGTSLSARIVVTDLTAVLGPAAAEQDGEEFPADVRVRLLVENTGSRDLTDLRVIADVFARSGARTALHAALDGGRPGLFVTAEAADVRPGGAVPAGDAAGVTITVPGGALGWGDPAGDSGVYPVRLTALLGGEVLDRVTTAVVFVERGLAPLQTVMVWPLDAPPWKGSGGAYPAGVDAPIRPGGRLDRLVRALAANPDAPVLVAPAAHLVEDLADRADGFVERTPDGGSRQIGPEHPAARRAGAFLQRLRTVIDGSPLPPLAGAYARADLPALAGADDPLHADARRAVSRSREQLERLAGHAPVRATFRITDRLDRNALGILEGAGIRHLLLNWDDVEAPDPGSVAQLPAAVRTLTAPVGQRMTATVADPWVAEALEQPPTDHGVVAAVQRVLAETAMMVMEAPYRQGRALLVLPPPGWDPDARYARDLLTAVSSAPWLELTGPTEQITAADDRTAATLLQPDDAVSDGLLADLGRTRVHLAALRQALLDVDGPVGGRPYEELDQDLLRATSRWWRGDGRRSGAALVRAVQAAVTAAFGSVSIPSDAAVTLTSETGSIPVTLQRPRGQPVRVQVTLASPRLDFPAGDSATVDLTRAHAVTRSFRARSRSTGTFSLRVRVTDPSGAVLLAENTLTVQSTAISGPALLITGGVVAALLVAGLLRRRRPRRRLRVVAGGKR